MKNLTLSHSVTHLTHLQAQTLIHLTHAAHLSSLTQSSSHLTHAIKLASLSLASASVKHSSSPLLPQSSTQARLCCLSQALAVHKSAFCTAALSAQRLRRSLHSRNSALLYTAACSALCTGNVIISKLLSFFYFDFLFHFLGSVFFFFFHFSQLHQVLN